MKREGTAMKQVFLVMLLAGFLVGSVQAGAKDPAVFVPIVNYVVQDTNRWEIWQDFGRFVTPLPGNQPGGFWPKGSDRNYLFRKAELLGVESPPGPVARNASGVVLYPSIPNPSYGACFIRYALPEPSPVTLRVYDVSGRLVRELEKGLRSAGVNSVCWDGRDEFGKPAVNGVYFYRLEVSDKSWVSKTVLLH
jgi:hypothetical protein